MIKNRRLKEGFSTIEAPLVILLLLFVFFLGLSAVTHWGNQVYVTNDMNTLVQESRLHGYATKQQVEGVAQRLAISRGYDVDDVQNSIMISRSNANGEIVGERNSLNGAVHGELAPEDRVARGSGEYILVELQYEIKDSWWVNIFSTMDMDSGLKYLTFSERIGSEYYLEGSEFVPPTGGGMSD